MFDFMKNELFYALGNLLDKKIISNKIKVVCFEYNHYSKLTVSFLLGAGVNRERILIIDCNNKGDFKGIPIIGIKNCLVPYKKDIIILLATERNKEVLRQLARLGYKKNIQVYETLNVSSKLYKHGSWLRIHYPDSYNKVLNGWGYYLYKHTHKDVCSLVGKNKKFKNLHVGKRCFIMGNGPSLKEVNFELLANEYVFGVNQIMDIDGWEKANINYWVCIDGNYLGMLNCSEYSFFQKIEKFDGKKIVGFVPVEARFYCKQHELEQVLDLNYVNFKQQYINLDQMTHISEIDLEKFIMQPYNAVIACINIALYMGFKEIYLVGCNQTVLKDEIECFLGENTYNMHAIQRENDVSLEVSKDRIKEKGMYFEIKTQVVQLLQYRILSSYCKKENSVLINLTYPTLIQDIPCKTMEEILNG